MKLIDLKPAKRKSKKRLGRGEGSGHGSYSTRGMKGQGSRAGGPKRPGFEGGQMPFIQKIPKLKGFKSKVHTDYQVVNLSDLNDFDNGMEITKEMLIKKNLISKKNLPVKLLADGQFTKKNLKIKLDKISAKAKEILEKNESEFIETK